MSVTISSEHIRGQFALSRKSLLFLVGGLLIFVFFLFFMDSRAILRVLETTNPFYYLLAFAVAILNMLFHSLTWRSILKSLAINTTY